MYLKNVLNKSSYKKTWYDQTCTELGIMNFCVRSFQNRKVQMTMNSKKATKVFLN